MSGPPTSLLRVAIGENELQTFKVDMVGQPICETEPPAPKFAWIFFLERRIDPFTNKNEFKFHL